MNFTKISFEKKDSLYYLGIGLNNEKSLTTLTETSLSELRSAFTEVNEDKEARGLIIFSHVPDVFLAGMDVAVIDSLSSEAEAIKGTEAGQEIFNILEDLKCPTMALVDGICLGGGLEMSLACDKIMVSTSSKTKLGLPEVMLGVLPGFGGTYRLPRKIGLTGAMDLILTGKQVPSKKAFKLGLADFIVPKEKMLELAPAYLTKKRKQQKVSFKDKVIKKASDNFFAKKIIFQKAREGVLKATKGFYPAPLKIIEHLEENIGKKRQKYLESESRSFAELSQTTQSKNLRHIYFLQDASKKKKEGENLHHVKKGAVLGAGTMGGGIAWLFADNNQNPLMKDISSEGLRLGLKQSSSIFYKKLKRKRMTELEFEQKQRSITPTLNFGGFKSVDLVVEAVVENMNVKKKVFSELEEYVTDDCLLTSNTSSLSITEMSEALKNKKRFAGLHFFNPVNKMPLVEIIRHDGVSEETISSLYNWCLEVKKTPVVVKDGPGFLVNRILAPFLNEAAYLLSEGISIEALDLAIINFGLPMGPCRLMDEIGLDVCEHVGKIMEEGIGERMKASTLSSKIVEAKFLGKKTSKGFYDYDSSSKKMGVNPEILKFLPKKKISMNEVEIQMRLILPMINEASYILQDKIVEGAADVDLGLIFGIGFPPFKGGLLKYADSEGVSKIRDAIVDLSKKVSETRFNLSPYLENLAEQNKTFYR